MLSSLCRLAASSVLCLVGLGSALHAQQPAATSQPNRIMAAVDDQQRFTLPGSVPPFVKAAADIGSLPINRAMGRMVLVLKPSEAQQKQLDALVAEQQNPSSPNFHKWLTPDQFHAKFGPSPADVAQVTAWLQSRGFSNVKASGNRVEFSGTVGTVETAFRTKMHQFRAQVNGAMETHISNASEISIPAALSPVVAGVLSLNDFHTTPAHQDFGKAKRDSNGKWVRTGGQYTISDGNGNYAYMLAPGDVRKIYGMSSLPANVDGTGVSVTVIGRSNVQLTDLQVFRKLFSVPGKDPDVIISGPDPGLESINDAGESTLDLEWISAIAPNADVKFVTAASTDTTDGIALAAAYAVENATSPIVTVSYGACEQHFGPTGNLYWKTVWEQAAAQGMSVLISTGDGGAAQCDADLHQSPAVMGANVNGLASTPFTLAVGGTQFAENGNWQQYWDSNSAVDGTSAVGYIPEAAWNESCDPNSPIAGQNCAYGQSYTMAVGGGGGRSNCAEGTVDGDGNVTCTAGYPKPWWQSGLGVPNDSVRDIPDVSLNASGDDDPYILCFMAGCQYTVNDSGQYVLNQSAVAGGTSISAPVMAGILALVEQQNGQWQGLVNPILYKLASQKDASCSSSDRTDPSAAVSCIFNDVTSGSNSVPGLNGYGTDQADFMATPGYDLATGLGSVNVANLVKGWKSGIATTPSSTTLAVGAQTAKHGTPIDVKIAVKGSAGTPTGDTVLETDKYGTGDQYTLTADGTWSGKVADLPGGTYTLTARYAGDGTYASSTSAAVPLTITPEDSKSEMLLATYDFVSGQMMEATSVPYYGYQIYFKGYISAASGQGTPTGNVTVMMDGAKNMGSATLTADGGFLIGTTDEAVGDHTFVVQYSGDNSFNPSTSVPSKLKVPKGESVTSLSSIGGPSNILAVIVSNSGTATATGTVQVFDNGKAISGQLTLSTHGPVGEGYTQAYFSHEPFTNGLHVLTATYSGDDNYLPVTPGSDYARPLTMNVDQPSGTTPTTTSFKMISAPTLQMGQIATFTFSVAPQTPNGQMPSGMVVLLDQNGNWIASGNLVNGQASATSYMDFAGSYNLRAQYQGDNTFASSLSSNSATLTIPKLTPVTTFTTSADYLNPGAQITLNFTAQGVMVNQWVEQDPIGTVTFSDSLNGGAAVPLGTFPVNLINAPGRLGGYSGRFALSTGTHLLTAVYSGNPNFNPVTSTATVVITPPDFVLTSKDSSLSIPAGTSASAALTLTPVLGFSGATNITCTGAPVGATCTLTPNQLNLSSAQNVTVTVSIPAAAPTQLAQKSSPLLLRGLGGLSLAGLALLFIPRRWKQGRVWLAFFLMLIPMGCGSSSTPKATLLSIASSSAKAATGTEVTLTATLDALTTTPTGTVTFMDGTTSLGSASLTQGTATLKTSSLAIGAHAISAVYSGDKHNEKSTSITLTQIITGSAKMTVTATSGTAVHSVDVPVTVK